MLLSSQNSYFYSKYGAEKSIDMFKEAGYDAIDMSLFCMSDDNDILCGDSMPTYVDHMRAHAEKQGLVFDQAHAPIVFQWKAPNVMDEIYIPRIARSMEVAARLGAKVIVIHPLQRSAYWGAEEERLQFNTNVYRRLLPYAHEYNIKIGIENLFRIHAKRKCIDHDVCSRAEEFCRYIDALDDDYVVANLDIGHSAIVGREPQDAIRILGDRLYSLHVHDNDYTADQHSLPGLGLIDFEEVMKALAQVNYKGNFTFECDGFLYRFPDPVKIKAAQFMVHVGRHWISRFEYYRSQFNK